LAYGGKGYRSWEWEHQLTYEALQAIAPGFRLLEIGAGEGAFVRRITPALTPKERVLCTEYSTLGLERIQAYGVQCLAKDVRDSEFGGYEGAFDVICMFQVLEHMDRLDELFARLALLAKPNASCFIAVPNPKRIEFSELHEGLLDMPPNHVGRWNRNCFELMGRRFGWKVERHEIETSEGFLSKVKNYSIYRYLLSRQRPQSLANRIERIRSRSFRRLIQVLGVCISVVSGIPSWPGLWPNSLGSSQWIHLRRHKP
jgi:SAM-dependent methyltransferase